MSLKIRHPAVSGLFYPADPEELRQEILTSFRNCKKISVHHPKALIVPHAGYIYSGSVAASAYQTLTPFKEKISRVVLLGPSHRVAFSGIALSQASIFKTPLGEIPVDTNALEKIKNHPGVMVSDRAHAQEHSLEVHLPFLQTVLKNFSLVPLVVGEADPEEVAHVLKTLWGGEETLIVASSDLSHYLDYDTAKAFDAQTAATILSLDEEKLDPEGACGFYPVRGLLKLARQNNLKITTADLCNSGDTSGSKDRVVGYGAWILEEKR